MPIRPTLITEISAALAGALPSLTSADAASDLFEGYVFGLVLRAARAEGALVSYEDSTGSSTTDFVFRTSPGYLYSTTRRYTHAVLDFGTDALPLEAHLGVRVEGKSGVLHECDVAVLHRLEALMCRKNGVSPRQSKLCLAVECKFYAAEVPLGLARSFLGLVADISATQRYYVVNTGSRSSEKLLAHQKRHWEHRIVPGSSRVSVLEGLFRDCFKNYKARA